MPFQSFQSYSSNKGSVLAIGLIILTAITLISISSLQRSGIQEKMVGNIQHQEMGFHVAHGELEQIYQYYATQASATEALTKPIEKINTQLPAGHVSSYASQYAPTANVKKNTPRMTVSSNIEYKGDNSFLIDGFSYGSFTEFSFIVTSQSREPGFGGAQGKTLSNQEMGIKFIGPAGS